MSFFYRLFDLLLESSAKFPGFPLAQPGKPAVTVLQVAPEEIESADFEVFHEWKTQGGQVTIIGARRDKDYLLRFPRLADFHLPADLDSIRMTAHPGTALSTLCHLLLDQVIPRWLNQQGRLVVHSSAVILPGGQAVAFVGNSGMGKSTLAASFYAAGSEIIADDSVILECGNDGVHCLPAYPSLRLWPDSLENLQAERDHFTAVSNHSRKRQMLLGADAGSRCRRVKLDALFILKEPLPAGIQLEPAVGRTALMSIIESIFALDVSSRSIAQHNFRAAVDLLSSGLRVLDLYYDRDYALLPKVQQRISSAVDKLVRDA